MWYLKHSFLLSLICFGVLNVLSIETLPIPGRAIFLVLTMAAGSLNPYLSLQIILAFQVLVFPGFGPITLSQVFGGIWLAMNSPRILQVQPSVRNLLWRIAPFLCLVIIVSMLKGKTDQVQFAATVFLACLMAYLCYKSTRSDPTVAFNLALGSFTAAMPFLLSQVGLTYFSGERQIAIQGAERAGLIRFAAGLGDFNYIGACILCSFSLTVALLISVAYEKTAKLSHTRVLMFLFMTIAGPLAIFATLSRASIAGIPAAMICVLWFAFRDPRIKRKLATAAIVLITVTIVAIPYLEKVWSPYWVTVQQLDFDPRNGGEVARFNLFLGHLEMMMDHPLLGISEDPVKTFGVAAHNTFVEAGSQYGILGALAFLYLAVLPFFRLKPMSAYQKLCFVPPYLMCLFSMFWLSMGGWKFFWTFLVLLLAMQETAWKVYSPAVIQLTSRNRRYFGNRRHVVSKVRHEFGKIR